MWHRGSRTNRRSFCAPQAIEDKVWEPLKNRLYITYFLPRDFKYLFDLRSPILDAFFFTASVLRLSFAAILEVGLVGKSFLSRLTSAFVHGFGALFLFEAFFFFATFFFFAILLLPFVKWYVLKFVPLFWHCSHLKYNLWMVFYIVKVF